MEAIAGICFLASCLFDQSSCSLAFRGGLSVWFFLASLLGMFGSKDFLELGFGAEALNVFNKITLVGLFNVNAITTVGTGDVNTDFIWKLGILAAIAVVCYAAGAVRFTKKDLPL